MALTDDAHTLIREHFTKKTKLVAIDATCGNGFDTEFLVALGFHKVHAFDVQKVALDNTQHRLSKSVNPRVELHLASHERIPEFVEGKVACIMFNFGYLPSGDKSITTTAETTIRALEASTKFLEPDGLISLMCYPGHPSGEVETEAIREWSKTLGDQWLIETHLAASPKPTAPILYLLKRKNVLLA